MTIRAWLRERLLPGRVELTRYDGSGSGTFDHYWRWPITVHVRREWRSRVSAHGVQSGWRDHPRGTSAYEQGIRQRAFMSIFWFGPVGLFVGTNRPILDRRRLGHNTSWDRA